MCLCNVHDPLVGFYGLKIQALIHVLIKHFGKIPPKTGYLSMCGCVRVCMICLFLYFTTIFFTIVNYIWEGQSNLIGN